MTYIWNQGGVTIVGNADKNISPYLKAWIKQGNTCVVGVIGEGTSKEVQANWNSPFENDTIGGKFEKNWRPDSRKNRRHKQDPSFVGSDMGRATARMCSTWCLKLYALGRRQERGYGRIAVSREVCITERERNGPPSKSMPAGSNLAEGPAPVSINIGRTALYTPCLIAGMTQPLDKEKTKDGHLVRCEVNLQIETSRMLNRSEIDRTYG